MARVVDRIGRCRLDALQRPASFEALTRAIVYQQLSGKAAATIYRRFQQVVGRRRPNPGSILAALPERSREAGLSRQKTSYLLDLAERVNDGRLSLRGLARQSDEQVVERLTSVKGIGRWTAEMFLIFHLGRLDVLPVGDLGIRGSARLIYGLDDLPSPRELEAIAAPWRPYRSAGCWYLWRSRRTETLAPMDP